MKTFTFSFLFFLATLTTLTGQHALQMSVYSTHDIGGRDFSLGKLSLAYSKTNEKGFEHTLELFDLKLDFENIPENIDLSMIPDSILSSMQAFRTDLAIGVKYRFMYPLADGSNTWVPYLGASILSGIYYSSVNPYRATAFKATYHGWRNQLSLTGVMRHNFSSHLYLDLGLILNSLSFDVNRNHTDNPSLPLRQQTTTFIDFSNYLFSRFQARMGLGVRL